VIKRGDPCVKTLRETHKHLMESGVHSLLEDNGQKLVVPIGDESIGIKAVFIAECRKGGLELTSLFKGVTEMLEKLDERRRAELLEKLLRINLDNKISVGMGDGIISFQPWGLSQAEPEPLVVVFGIKLALSFEKWLVEQLKRAERGEPLEDYKPEVPGASS